MKKPLRAHSDFKRSRGFKYIRGIHRDDMLNRGVFRLGTYREFRDMESRNLNDAEEGLNTTEVDDLTTLDQFHANSVVHQFMKPAPGVDPATISLSGVNVAVQFDFPTFCFSYDNSPNVFQSICDNQNEYDTVVEIMDLFALADLMSTFLSRLIDTRVVYLCLPITYVRTSRTPAEASPENLARAFEKSERFTGNREGRIVFFTPDERSNMEIYDFDGFVGVPEAARFLREASLPHI